MTFIEKYEYLFTELNAFGRNYPATFSKNISADEIKAFAKERLNSELPIIKGQAKNILADLWNCGNDINAQIIY